jgi:hypothetical protein
VANRWSHPHGKTSSEVVPFTWQPTVDQRCRQKHRGSTTELRSGSWRLPQGTGSGRLRWSANSSRLTMKRGGASRAASPQPLPDCEPLGDRADASRDVSACAQPHPGVFVVLRRSPRRCHRRPRASIETIGVQTRSGERFDNSAVAAPSSLQHTWHPAVDISAIELVLYTCVWERWVVDFFPDRLVSAQVVESPRPRPLTVAT